MALERRYSLSLQRSVSRRRLIQSAGLGGAVLATAGVACNARGPSTAGGAREQILDRRNSGA